MAQIYIKKKQYKLALPLFNEGYDILNQLDATDSISCLIGKIYCGLQLDQLIDIVKVKAKQGEIFIKIDLKPPYPDTPEDWEDKIESAFSGYQK